MVTTEITWYEVFHTNVQGEVKTILASSDLEKCIKVYRKLKLYDKSAKIDKWLDADYLDFPMSYKCILD